MAVLRALKIAGRSLDALRKRRASNSVRCA